MCKRPVVRSIGDIDLGHQEQLSHTRNARGVWRAGRRSCACQRNDVCLPEPGLRSLGFENVLEACHEKPGSKLDSGFKLERSNAELRTVNFKHHCQKKLQEIVAAHALTYRLPIPETSFTRRVQDLFHYWFLPEVFQTIRQNTQGAKQGYTRLVHLCSFALACPPLCGSAVRFHHQRRWHGGEEGRVWAVMIPEVSQALAQLKFGSSQKVHVCVWVTWRTHSKLFS